MNISCMTIPLLLGSLGPSTVTLIACEYVAYWAKSVSTTICTVSIFPGERERERTQQVNMGNAPTIILTIIGNREVTLKY